MDIARKATTDLSEFLVIWPTFELGFATLKVFGVLHFNHKARYLKHRQDALDYIEESEKNPQNIF
jgi:hypothetical protein